MMQLFVGNNVALGSAPMKAFVTGMHNAFYVSTVLVLIAAGISFVRGKEDRSKLAEEHAAAAISE
jgi:hypothetical protein